MSAAHGHRIAATLVLMVAGWVFAAPADADDNGYLDYLRGHGVPVGYAPHYVGLGYKICAQLHEGMSPEAAAKQFGVVDQIWSPQVVDAAQQELCPDTLRTPAP